MRDHTRATERPCSGEPPATASLAGSSAGEGPRISAGESRARAMEAKLAQDPAVRRSVLAQRAAGTLPWTRVPLAEACELVAKELGEPIG